ncbi:MAG: tetraacyldisaccharide 4'-kinase [Thermodesulfovibrionales bacterium]|nr:tetraacyldisaccharide 4'-kinase [Thermodesulfovibrionales bacterium]
MYGPLEFIYYLGYRINTALDLANCRKLEGKVISIGNITTGGTGKTPMTIALANEALRRGFHPCVLTRGYGGKAKGPFIVSSEMYVEDVGDEPMLMAEHMKGVSVIKGADRYESGRFAHENMHDEPDLFILDDGFQHRKLHRDLDIVLINSRDPFYNRKLLPMGRLREPLAELSRADVLVFTKCEHMEMPEALYDDVRKFNSSAPVFLSRHRVSFIRNSCDEDLPEGWLSGKKVFAFSGIGEPEAFMDTLERSGAEVVGHEVFQDHHRFDMLDMKHVQKQADLAEAGWIITTEKDKMRLRHFKCDEFDNFNYVGIELEVEKVFYDHVFDSISQAGQDHATQEEGKCSST